MYAVSIVAALWVFGRILTQWRFDPRRVLFVPTANTSGNDPPLTRPNRPLTTPRIRLPTTHKNKRSNSHRPREAVTMVDLLTHVLVAFALVTVARWRYEQITPPLVTVAMVGAASPDLTRLALERFVRLFDVYHTCDPRG